MLGERERMVSEQKERELDYNLLTESQKFIAQRFSTMVREVLTVVEAAVPPEGRQFKAVRTMLNDRMYEARNDFIDFFKDNE